MWVFPRELLGLRISGTPTVLADFIQGFHGPFDDVERINTAFAFRGKLVDAVRDPAGSVSGHNLDAGKLFIREAFIKLLKHGFTVPVGDQDNRIGIMIYDNRDVLVAFLIAGLVDADIHQSVQASGPFRFQIVQSS